MKFALRAVGTILKLIVGRPAIKGWAKLGDIGFSKGARGNGAWLGIGLLVAGAKQMNKLGTRKREVVFTKTLKPGETFNISHLLEDRKGRPTS
ncbi:MAG: hypothetical protein ACI8Y4_003427 [Candidatus Poriferisodalaceae bacterium]|jgi:hypothetical protein